MKAGALMLAVLFTASSALAGGKQDDVRPDDELWIVSTRHLGCCAEATLSDYRVQKYDPRQGWQTTPIEALTTAHWDGVTVCYVHGNRIETPEDVIRGWNLYRELSVGSAERLRFIIWSWPSDRQVGQLRDVRRKAERADFEADYLARFLSRLEDQRRFSFVAFSYGSRIVLGALQQQEPAPTAHQLTNAVLIAAAIHNDWLMPDGLYAGALTQLQGLLLLYNPCDRALRYYHVVDPASRPRALGATGLSTAQFAQHLRTEQINTSPYVGRSHSERRYYESPDLIEDIRRFALFR